MKRCFSYFIVLFILFGCSPKPNAVSSEGQAIYLADYQGRWVLVHYWADWCHACMAEWPVLVALQQQFPKQVQIIAVNFDSKANEVLNQIKTQYHLNFPMTASFSHEKIATVASIPTTFVFSPQGKWVKTLQQPQSLSQWRSLLQLTAASSS